MGGLRASLRTLGRTVAPPACAHRGEALRLPGVCTPLPAQRPPGQARTAARGASEPRRAGLAARGPAARGIGASTDGTRSRAGARCATRVMWIPSPHLSLIPLSVPLLFSALADLSPPPYLVFLSASLFSDRHLISHVPNACCFLPCRPYLIPSLYFSIFFPYLHSLPNFFQITLTYFFLPSCFCLLSSLTLLVFLLLTIHCHPTPPIPYCVPGQS